MPYLLLGYDVEATDPDVTRGFIDSLRRVHGDLEAPGTLFLRGETLVANAEAIRATQADGLFEYGQHTWSHVRFKTLWQVNEKGEEVHEGGSFAEIAREIDRAQTAVREVLGVTPIGLTTPWGYYRGLGDRPDLLSLLHMAGIRYLRSWMRNANDWVPVELSRQPFFYEAQGFPSILECPLTGRHDCDWGHHLGFEPREFGTVDAYADYVVGQLDEIADNDWAFVYNQHDTTTMRWDRQMVVVRRLIERSRELGIEVARYEEYYQERTRQRASERDSG